MLCAAGAHTSSTQRSVGALPVCVPRARFDGCRCAVVQLWRVSSALKRRPQLNGGLSSTPLLIPCVHLPCTPYKTHITAKIKVANPVVDLDGDEMTR